MSLKGLQFEEATAYLEKHKINEIYQSLAQSVLMDCPENPREYLIKHLQTMKSVKARNQNAVFFTRENLQALSKFYDKVGRGFITLTQYHEAMTTIGAVNYSQNPIGHDHDRINVDAFVQEASAALRRVASMPEITHVLFDMDGILLETESVYSKVTLEILQRYGIMEFPWAVKAKMMGTKSIDAARILIADTNLPMSPEEYVTERDRLHSQLFPHCEILPGVLKLVKHLKLNKIPIAVATSSHKSAFLLKSQLKGELFELFDGHIICGDDPRVKRGKPYGDIFLEASKLINSPDPKKTLVFEDSPSGMMAGIAAGMNVIAIPDINLRLERDLLQDLAEILPSMEAFVPEKYGLPPY